MNFIHGHEVMEMMIKTGKQYTLETLEQEIFTHFGSETRFYTCSSNNLTARDLIHFLAGKGKITLSDNRFTTDASKICNH